MKIYKAAIIGLGPSGLAVNKLIYNNIDNNIIAFEKTSIENRNNFFGFWLTDWMMPFESLIEKKWDNWELGNTNIKIIHEDKKFPYCVISYKTWREFCLNTKNKLKIKNKKVIRYEQINNYFKIITEDRKEYFVEKIYDSRSDIEKNNQLIQHFFGLNIKTADKKFDEKKVTLMHFTEDENVIHFIYVLPFRNNKALVESTVFSTEVLNEEWYRKKIYDYLKDFGISEFNEISSEKGAIPMFFSEIKNSPNPNVYNIGIRGGACKPSTGYAFSFLIKQIQFLKNTNKNNVQVHPFIEKQMDRIFLNYLKKNNENGISFINLAKKLNGYEFQTFMMGQSSFLTKLKIISSMPKIPFLRSIFK